MQNLIVEVGMKLDKDINFYHNMLISHGLKKVFECDTHDVYYTKQKSFDGMTENQIKNSCIRLRNPSTTDKQKEEELISKGYFKVFDTVKKDYHYKNDKIKSIIQLQDIKDIGLVVYYDNPDYYGLELDNQREKLLQELNYYGFSFKKEELGIDKLRTLYYKKQLYSKNQNG